MTVTTRLYAGAAALILALGATPAVRAQEMVFIIRHAEKAAQGDDPALTVAGRGRAAAWAAMLGDAGIDAIYNTDARRSRETGEIIAGLIGVETAELPLASSTGVVDLIAFDHAEDRVLVIAHTETIPSILGGLGVPGDVEIAEDDFANLFVVAFAASGDADVVRLRMP